MIFMEYDHRMVHLHRHQSSEVEKIQHVLARNRTWISCKMDGKMLYFPLFIYGKTIE